MAITNPIAPVLTAQDIQRFWSKVDKTPGQGPNGNCWEWTAGRYDKDGYGAIQFGARGAARRKYIASRIAYLLATGEWPALNVCHTCDNPPCCRDEHLFEGTDKDNMLDAKAKGRLATGIRNGQSLHPEARKHGTANAAAKLTEILVREIRALYATGEYSHTDLAKRCGVGASTVRRAIKHQNWAQVA